MKRTIQLMGIFSLLLLLMGGCNNLQRELAYMSAMGLICAIMLIKTYFPIKTPENELRIKENRAEKRRI